MRPWHLLCALCISDDALRSPCHLLTVATLPLLPSPTHPPYLTFATPPYLSYTTPYLTFATPPYLTFSLGVAAGVRRSAEPEPPSLLVQGARAARRALMISPHLPRISPRIHPCEWQVVPLLEELVRHPDERAAHYAAGALISAPASPPHLPPHPDERAAHYAAGPLISSPASPPHLPPHPDERAVHYAAGPLISSPASPPHLPGVLQNLVATLQRMNVGQERRWLQSAVCPA